MRYAPLVIVGLAMGAMLGQGAYGLAPTALPTSDVTLGTQPPPHAGSLLVSGTSQGVSYPFTLPAGFNPLTVVGDGTGDGSWIIGNQGEAAAVCHWVGSSGSLAEIPLVGAGNVSLGQIPPIEYGAAIGPSGDLWVAFDSWLVDVQEGSLADTAYTVPVASGSPQADVGVPAQLTGYHVINAIAVSSAGDVAIAEDRTTSIAEFDPDIGEFSTIALPPNTATSATTDSMAFDSDGALIAVVGDYSADSETEVALEYSPVTGWQSLGSDYAVYGGSGEVLLEGRYVSELAVSAGREATQARVTGLQVGGDGALAVLPDGVTAVAGRGIELISGSGKRVLVSLGTQTLSRMVAVPYGVEAKTLTGVGPVASLVVSGDREGNLWFIALRHGSRVVGVVESRAIASLMH